jgi:hypothetical protein
MDVVLASAPAIAFLGAHSPAQPTKRTLSLASKALPRSHFDQFIDLAA